VTASGSEVQGVLDHSSLRTLDTLAPASQSGSDEDKEDVATPFADAPKEDSPRSGAKGGGGVYDRVERILRLISILGVTASALLAAWQYVESQSREKRNHSLGYIVRWQEGDEIDAFARLQRTLEPMVKAAGAAPAGGETVLRLHKARIGQQLAIEVASRSQPGNPSELARDIDIIVDFYSRLEFCITARICDDTLLRSYFAADLAAFWDYLAPYAQYRRKNHYPRYAEAIESLNARFR